MVEHAGTRSMVAQAMAAIGEDDDATDWQLRPKDHADALPKEGRALADLLRSPRVQAIMDAFTRHDGAAGRHQAKFKGMARTLIAATAVAVLCGGLYLFVQAIPGLGVAKAWSWVILSVQAAAVLAVTVYTFSLKESSAYEDWMLERAAAETERSNLFRVICSRPPAAHGAPHPCLLALQFEYFRRYQLDVQINYYTGRARQHRAASVRYNHLGFILVLMTGLVAMAERLNLGPGSGPVSEATASALLALAGLALPVIYQGQDMLKLINGDRRNALRYRVTAQNLKDLAQSIYDLRDRIDEAGEGARAEVQEFMVKVNEQISLENRQWQYLPKPASGNEFPEFE